MRVAVLAAWAALIVAFWLGARGADAGPLAYVAHGVEDLARRPWAPVALLGAYLARPLLLLPITLLNLASGLLLGPAYGLPFAALGTLLSATSGYAIGRSLGTRRDAEALADRWPLVRALRRRGFETVVAGGLMYLHADMVNVPSGLLRIRFPTFLAGIALGNALTLTTAVLTGASIEGGLADATVAIDAMYLGLAAALLVISFALAYVLRRRMRPRG